MRTDTATVIGHSAADKVVLFGGLPLAGLALGYFLPRIADWAAEQRWVPMQGPLELISGWDAWWVVVVTTVAGLVAGLLLGAAALEDTLRVTVTNAGIEFFKKQHTTSVPRDQVASVFLDGKEIVVLGRDSGELARERHDELKSGAPKIGAAFRAHGYPWSDAGDPYADRFRRWVEDDPDLPPAVNAVLRARQKAFAGSSSADDLRELRAEVAKLGYVVRDKDKKQYWRPAKS
ncbi:hypothetical protein Kfla_0883 [Kribbella flavida DSM 17836]|uniref:YqeB n=1 Tax=Kribbella flavida (strain DSM 17836 / JCM 10339 / NBRC 14399) TaxID=479435 RepID=D2PZZ0_KRIFD|nr:hypothetical protein [Kribbella flavida]ADB29988.1 hypothetical protein Kfla_0883 [Kribbella flavida DSM 17836]